MEAELKERFRGYHVDISFYPSGGLLSCYGCEECGTSEDAYECISWKTHTGQDLESAMTALEEKMFKRYGGGWRPDPDQGHQGQ